MEPQVFSDAEEQDEIEALRALFHTEINYFLVFQIKTEMHVFIINLAIMNTWMTVELVCVSVFKKEFTCDYTCVSLGVCCSSLSAMVLNIRTFSSTKRNR